MTNKGGNTLNQQTEKAAVPEVGIDWLQYTAELFVNMPIMVALRYAVPEFTAFADSGFAVSPVRGYTHGRELVVGKQYYHHTRPEQRILVVLSGQDMTELRKRGMDDDNMLAYLLNKDHRVTRIDLALDLHNWNANPHDLVTWNDAGKLSTKAKRVASYADTKTDGKNVVTSETVYIGSSASTKQLRCYNKAAERGVSGDWTRLELVLRDEQARVFLSYVRGQSLNDAILGAFRAFVRCPGTWLDRATEGIAVDMPETPRKLTNRQKWLLGQVATALDTQLSIEAQRGENTTLDAFRGILARYSA